MLKTRWIILLNIIFSSCYSMISTQSDGTFTNNSDALIFYETTQENISNLGLPSSGNVSTSADSMLPTLNVANQNQNQTQYQYKMLTENSDNNSMKKNPENTTNSVLYLFEDNSSTTDSLKLGSPCRQRRYNGTCKLMVTCPYAMAIFNIKDYQPLKAMFCGYEKKSPKVCCPDPVDSNIVFVNEATTTKEANAYSTSTEFTTNRIIRSTTPRNIVYDLKPLNFRQNNLKDPMTAQAAPVNQGSILPGRDICGTQVVNIENKIIGGEITDIGEIPWLVRLKYRGDPGEKDQYRCGGTLISDRHVVTAAHCLIAAKPYKLLSVTLGEWDETNSTECFEGRCTDKPVERGIKSVKIYPAFDKQYYTVGDIGIIHLDQPVKFTDLIRPICLPTTPYVAKQDYNSNNVYLAAGWGLTEYGNTSPISRKVYLPAVPMNICRQANPMIPESSSSFLICAGGMKNKDTCAGDSGGPLTKKVSEDGTVNWYLYGVTSIGFNRCGAEGLPSAYTRVTQMMDWILNNIEK